MRRSPLRVLCLAAVMPMAACSDASPSTLDPSGPRAESSATAFWILLAVASLVCVVVIAMVVLTVVRRRGSVDVRTDDARGFVLGYGVIMPAVVLAATFALSVTVLATDSQPSEREAATIEVTGHQWFWEVSYPADDVVTANEIHVPVGVPVRLVLTSDDVIHSFWVPELIPKTDLIPGRVNTTWLQADEAGRFRGQCAEYCGLQHGHMAFQVVAEPMDDFRAWVDEQAADAETPDADPEQRGLEIFTSTSCATCHTVRGTGADGEVGPDLTHLATRDRIGAGVLPNDREHLEDWVANSQRIKPGIRMPPQPLPPEDLDAVVAYLESLR